MIKQNRFFNNAISLIIIFCVVIAFILFDKNPNIIFVGNIIICLIICLRAKFSIYSIKTILINYVLVSLFFQYNFKSSYGILQLEIYDLNYDIMNILVFVYTTIINFYLINSDYLQIEKEKQFATVDFNKTAYTILSMIAIVFAIIAFPHFNGSGTARFDSLLPGNGWNHVTIIALLLALPGFKKNLCVKIAYAFCLFWFLFQGERVDMIGLLFCLIIIFGSKKLKEFDRHQMFELLRYVVLSLFVLFIMVYIGEKRSGYQNINIQTLFQKVLIQNTASDLGYVYNLSIKYKQEEGLLYGSTYMQYLKSAIPILSVNTIDLVLSYKYISPGGFFILSEPYMNFGVLGVFIFAIVEVLVIEWITKRKSKYSYFIYLYILATLFRTSWYGLWYIETGLIYILPALFVLANNIGRGATKFESKTCVSNCSYI